MQKIKVGETYIIHKPNWTPDVDARFHLTRKVRIVSETLKEICRDAKPKLY